MNIGYADVLPWVEWDTLEINAGGYVLDTCELFHYPVSANKSKLKTSMVMSNHFPPPNHMNVTNLQVVWSSQNSIEDMKTFTNNTMYEFNVDNKLMDHGPLSRFKYWNCVDDLAKILKELRETYQINEANLAKDLSLLNEVEYRMGDNPIGHHITQGATFSFNVITDEPFYINKNFKMVVLLKGFISRSAV